MMKNSVSAAAAAFLCIAASVSPAADFDGSRPLICATVEALDCVAGTGCTKGTPDEIGAPAFMRIDFQKKIVVGPKRVSPVLFMDKQAEQILLQGTELGYGWVLALDAKGKMTTTLANHGGVFVMFGSCTPL
jgi:hypothetical protein